MPRTNSRRGTSRQNKANNGSGANAGKQHFIASTTSSGSANRVRVADDVSRRPLAPDVGRLHMPKQLQTQIHWIQSSFEFNKALASAAITENNLSFALSDLAIASSVAALFDQYALFAVSARVIIQTSAPAAANPPTYTTAIDYDGVQNLGSLAVLKGYSTSASTSILEIQERYIEPCNAPALYSGSVFTHFGQARAWVDTANTSTPHYGLRMIVSNLGAGVTGVISTEMTYVICARNVV